jgi:hypothetical protein
MSGPSQLQVKVAEHVLTGHKVAIKILNRKKIQAMDMEEKGGQPAASVYLHSIAEVEGQGARLWRVKRWLHAASCCCSPARDQDPPAVHASSYHPLV